MSFDSILVPGIKKAKENLADLKEKLREGRHMCDCEYCEIGEEIDEEEEQALIEEIANLTINIARMQRYAHQRGLISNRDGKL